MLTAQYESVRYEVLQVCTGYSRCVAVSPTVDDAVSHVADHGVPFREYHILLVPNGDYDFAYKVVRLCTWQPERRAQA